MKKIVISFILCFQITLLCAQFNVSSPTSYVLLNNNATYGVDCLILFNGISSMTDVTCTDNGKIEWKLYDGSFYSNLSSISPDNATGYLVYVNDVLTYYVWCIDYLEYLSEVTSLEIIPSDEACEQVGLTATANVPPIVYTDSNGNSRTLAREFTLSYSTAEYDGTGWNESTESYAFRSPLGDMRVAAPLTNTNFAITGDQWAEQLGIGMDSLYSSYYEAQAIACYPIGVIVEREGLNEKDRSETTVSGSGPLVVDFASNVNPLTTVYYEWLVWNVLTPSSYMRYSDENLRYTFNNSGEYYVKLIVNSASCQATDSIKVNVRESMLEVPNVFTPNGDGINDEFRVAYRSLATFRMMVFNRWGRIVYDSTNPAKGWDGRINGKNAAEGAYYYLIEAAGIEKVRKENRIKKKLSEEIN